MTMSGSPKPMGTGKPAMIFDAMRGGWVQPDVHRAGQSRAAPPHWEAPPAKGKRDPSHYELKHYGDWQLDMKSEQKLGLAPADWSVSSAMSDTRPNGRAMFDARFHGNAMGRARGGYSMMADARGMEFTAGKLTAAENLDSNFFAADMADETAAAEASAEKNKFGNNTNFSVFQSGELAMSGMSALQQATDTSKIDFN